MTEEKFIKLTKMGIAQCMPRVWFDLPESGFTKEEIDLAIESQPEKAHVYLGKREGLYYFLSQYGN